MRVFTNANIITMDPDKKRAEAMTVKDGRITFIGTNKEVDEYALEAEEVIDVKGRTIIPGFNDSHVHFIKGGQSSRHIDLSQANSHADIIEIGRKFILTNDIPRGEWIIGRGWDENYLLEKTPPLRNVLDQISTHHPIAFIRSCEHAVVSNSKALEVADIDHTTPQPDGGEWCKFQDGSPNGLFKDIARDLIYDQIGEPSKEAIKAMIREAVRISLENGVTSLQTDDFWSISSKDYKKIIDAYEELERAGELKVRIYEQCVLESPEALKSFVDAGYKTGYGKDFFKIGPFKMFVDGGVGVRSAYLYESYADDDSTSGSLIFPKSTLKQMMAFAANHGMQLTAHAIGDKASEIIMNIFAEINQDHPNKRPSIIHAHLLTEDLLTRFPTEEVITIGDAAALMDDIPMYRARLGKDRERYGYNYRTLLDNGGRLALSTDWPINSISPFKNLYTAVTRKDRDGALKEGWIPEERITLEEALLAYTSGSTYCSFEENSKGTLSVGKYADFVVLSDDIFEIDIEELPTVKVLDTYVGGDLCFTHPTD